MVSGFDPKGPRDAVFVPVGINYDRVIEDRVQVAALMTPEGEKPRFKFSPKVLFGYLAHNVALRLRGKLYRYGYACVSFGKPVSLRQYVTERGIDFRTLDESRRFAEIERLGADADAQGGRGRAGAAGLAGRDRHAGGRQAALRAGAEGASRELMRRLIAAARTSIFRAPIRTMRSRLACACCCCATSSRRRTGSIAPIRARRSCCATTPIRSRICVQDAAAARPRRAVAAE